MRQLIAGNWKMYGRRQDLAELRAMAEAEDLACDIAVCLPSTLLMVAADEFGPRLALGGQDIHVASQGAHTGDISAEQLVDAGATHVIIGHSERRETYAESDGLVQEKTVAAWRCGLIAIVCIGETDAERIAGTTLDVLGTQLAGSLPDTLDVEKLVIAYEPIWAIGTGKTPTVEDVRTVHAFIRDQLNKRFGEKVGTALRILYGGSVKPSNAAELLAVANVDGALVGGASLKASDFIAICKASRPA